MANDPMDVHNGEPEEQSGAGGPGGMGMVLATSDFITSGASLDIKLDTARQRVRSKDGAFQLRRPPESSLPNNTGLNRKKEEEEEEEKKNSKKKKKEKEEEKKRKGKEEEGEEEYQYLLCLTRCQVLNAFEDIVLGLLA